MSPETETPAAAALSLEEALSWRGCALDDVGGERLGRVGGVFVDVESGRPVWLAVAIARRGLLRRGVAKAVVVPARECAALPGAVWTAQPAAAIRAAPAVDPARPQLREHETAICAHYGIGPAAGRHAEVAGRAQGATTARPA
jgi:hypothetical protein